MESHCGGARVNLGPLQEQVLVTAEPPLAAGNAEKLGFPLAGGAST